VLWLLDHASTWLVTQFFLFVYQHQSNDPSILRWMDNYERCWCTYLVDNWSRTRSP
jgi:hypothetical protein